MIKKILIAMLVLSTYLVAAMNVQTASKAELMSISGIGEKKANSIIKYRKTKKLKSADDLLKVNGIGKGIVKNVKGNVKNKPKNKSKANTKSKSKKTSKKANGSKVKSKDTKKAKKAKNKSTTKKKKSSSKSKAKTTTK